MFDTQYGKAAVVLVGAMIVAGIESVATGKITRTDTMQEQQHNGVELAKGDELGRFYLGSTGDCRLAKSGKGGLAREHESQ